MPGERALRDTRQILAEDRELHVDAAVGEAQLAHLADGEAMQLDRHALVDAERVRRDEVQRRLVHEPALLVGDEAHEPAHHDQRDQQEHVHLEHQPAEAARRQRLAHASSLVST